MKNNWRLLVFGVIHSVILLLLFNCGLYQNSSLTGDVKLFFEYSSKIFQGLLPYRNFTVEYPPGALVFFTIPRLFGSTLDGYRNAFAAEILVFDLLALYFLEKLSRSLSVKPAITLIVYTLLILAIGPILIYRFDLIPAVMVLASLYFLSQKKFGLAWAMLAAGVITKIYPVVIAPIFLIYELSQRGYKATIKEIASCALWTEIIIAPFFILSPSGFVNSFTLQMQRGLQLESTYSSFILLLQNLGITEVYIKTTITPLATSNIVSDTASVLVKVAPVIMAAALFFLYWLFYRRYWNKFKTNYNVSHEDTANVIYYAFLAVLIFVLTTVVFSPQYLIWFLPIAPLITRPKKYVIWLALVFTAILTYYEFPLHYNLLQAGDPKLVYVLVARNILLIALALWLIGWGTIKRKTGYNTQ